MCGIGDVNLFEESSLVNHKKSHNAYALIVNHADARCDNNPMKTSLLMHGRTK